MHRRYRQNTSRLNASTANPARGASTGSGRNPFPYGTGASAGEPGSNSGRCFVSTLRGEPARVRALPRAGLAQLVVRPGVDATKVAAIGYCFGGTFALELARDGAQLAATVAFHAGLATANPADARNIAAACSRASARTIRSCRPPSVPRSRRRCARRSWRLEVYDGAVHGFANPLAGQLGHPAVQYHEPSHRRSWASMLALFGETISK